MTILGLTGSIGMGKSTAARMMRRLNVPCHDADATVHALMGRGGAAVPAIAAAFPGVVRDGRVDRAALGARVFGDNAALRRLETILHPRVRAAEHAFLRRQALARRRLVVLDVPLLFETGGERRCDCVLLVTAPAFLQAQRVLGRAGMTRERLDQVRAKQMREPEKRRRADVVVNTGLGLAPAYRQVRALVRDLRSKRTRCHGEAER
ncbi:dephospho-CoA kinase [Roseospira marina]|uniref:Dephospho-CoA kinase n=1 Tax=Roseospira marina TaxID=140057 RepID=A0A5M6IDU8_9PROT|nr:dephospho-CoA kinase [Roseospira marina]KAA5606242.1 dephospho-CoA kinase [Roseospira marina]MBB4314396.1 dephospho-CoA kinase [Roseospira marina]MBB5087556.1 dephospho-CoA kinase [Roseospira marina]